MSPVLAAITTSLLLCCLTAPASAVLTEDDQQELIRAHNFYRSKAQPTPTDMVAMEWDDQLAHLGEFYAVNCMLESNENKDEQSTEFDYVGEILHGSGNYSINLTSMVFEWFFDGRFYDYSQAACINENGEAQEDLEGCENYVQLVWAKTTKFGCGAYRCEEIMGLEEEADDEQSALMVVCYYGPGGGYFGVQPYSTGGEPCSACPEAYSECENNLCTAVAGARETASQVSLAATLLLVTALSALM